MKLFNKWFPFVAGHYAQLEKKNIELPFGRVARRRSVRWLVGRRGEVRAGTGARRPAVPPRSRPQTKVLGKATPGSFGKHPKGKRLGLRTSPPRACHQTIGTLRGSQDPQSRGYAPSASFRKSAAGGSRPSTQGWSWSPNPVGQLAKPALSCTESLESATFSRPEPPAAGPRMPGTLG